MKRILPCMALLIAFALMPGGAHVARGDAGAVSLSAVTGAVAESIPTRSTLEAGGRTFVFGAEGGHLSVAGRRVPVKIAARGGRVYLAVDANGDGKYSRNEVEVISPRARYPFVIAGKDPAGKDVTCPIVLRNLDVRMRGGKPWSTQGVYGPGQCLAGRVDGVKIALLDDNLDGRFTQDGQDAIRIGSAALAVPLGKTHRIGRTWYDLSVTSDGSRLTATPRKETSLAAVVTPIRTPALKGLVFRDAQTNVVFEFTADGAAGVPAGTYRLEYGVLASGNQHVSIIPTKESPAYPLKAGCRNTLRIGPPARVVFEAQLSAASGQLDVSPKLSVRGAGEEMYIVDFEDRACRPRVQMYEGKRKLLDHAMSYG